jgi:predicted O-methyltransferase YrrM
MLDERVSAVLARLEAEDAAERAAGLPSAQRSRQIARTTGQFLFSLAVSGTSRAILEIGGSRGYSTLWLAAAARIVDGRVLSLEHDPLKCEAWRRTIAEAGLEAWAELVQGDAHTVLAGLDGPFDLVFLDAEKGDYERFFGLVRPLLEPGAVVVADNILSHPEPLAGYAAARQADPTLESVTVPLDRGLEVSSVLRAGL